MVFVPSTLLPRSSSGSRRTGMPSRAGLDRAAQPLASTQHRRPPRYNEPRFILCLLRSFPDLDKFIRILDPLALLTVIRFLGRPPRGRQFHLRRRRRDRRGRQEGAGPRGRRLGRLTLVVGDDDIVAGPTGFGRDSPFPIAGRPLRGGRSP